MCALLFLLLGAVAWGKPLDYRVAQVEIAKWEGYRLKPYKDGQAVSVGIGHNLTSHREPIKPLYTAAEVQALFLRDFAVALDAARAGVTGFDDLPEAVQLVCIDLAFTCGARGFMRFTQLRFALSHRAYNVATVELYQSRWFHQVAPKRAEWALRVLRAQ